MPRAIAVIGSSLRHKERWGQLKEFLDSRTIKSASIETAYLLRDEIITQMREQLALCLKDEPVLLYYGGHGRSEFWAMSEDATLPYEDLAKMIAVQTAPMLVVNDCCFSYSLQSFLKKHSGGKSGSLGLIASSDTHELSNGGIFIKRLTAEWKDGKIHTPGRLYQSISGGNIVPRGSKLVVKRKQIRRYWYGIVKHHWYAEQNSKRWGVVLDYHFFAQPKLN